MRATIDIDTRAICRVLMHDKRNREGKRQEMRRRFSTTPNSITNSHQRNAQEPNRRKTNIERIEAMAKKMQIKLGTD